MKLFPTVLPLNASCYLVAALDFLTNFIPVFSYQGTIKIACIINALSALTLIAGVFLQNDLVIQTYLLYYLLFLLLLGIPLLLVPVAYPNVLQCPFLSTTWALLVLRLVVGIICFLNVHAYYTNTSSKAEMKKLVKDFLGQTNLHIGSVFIGVFDLASSLWSILLGSERDVQVYRHVYAINVLVSLGLLVGAYKKYSPPVWIYLVSCLIGLFCKVLGSIVIPILWRFRKLEWILSALNVIVRSYFFAVVYSFYVDLLVDSNSLGGTE